MFLSILSAVLLFLCFPPFNLGFLAWFALVPLFISLRKAPTRGDAFLRGYTAGLIFYALSLYWVIQVTFGGWLAFIVFEAMFWGVFGLLLYQSGTNRESSFGLLRVVYCALAWTVLEWARAHFPVFGFGWNLLAHSQSYDSVILQSANTVGVFGLGFAIALVNACLAQMIRDTRQETGGTGKETGDTGNGEWGTRRETGDKRNGARDFRLFLSRVSFPVSLAIIVFILIITHGLYHQNKTGRHVGDWRISVVQGNIPQSVKWEAMAREKINEIYLNLTELSAREGSDLIIWPEAAFPGYFNRDFDSQPVREMAKKLETPLLIGSTLWAEPDAAFNSALLLGGDGLEKGRYDKQVLVPFGEYVPFKFLLPGLKGIAESLGVSDFSFGKDKTVFELMNGEVKFSTLICFEDTLPKLAHEFVDRGAQFLTVITNDAWFGESGAAEQHLQASIFRAVEQGVPVVRAANTGVSAFISNTGKVLARVEDAKGKAIFVTGKKTFRLPVDNKNTIYRQAGWIFPYVAWMGFFMLLFLKKRGLFQ